MGALEAVTARAVGGGHRAGEEGGEILPFVWGFLHFFTRLTLCV
jgi:hypothetical protein